MLLIDKIIREKENELKSISIKDYVIGISYIAVETNAGIGLSYTFRNLLPSGCSVGDMNLTGMTGINAALLSFDPDPLKAAIGIAVINSLNKPYGKNISITEKFDFNNKHIAMIGYFRPVVKQIEPLVKKLDIFELKLTEKTLPSYYAKRILPDADLVLITGTSLIIHTTDEFLPYINKSAEVIFMGPTTPICNTLLKHGHIAGSIVSDKKGAIKAISQGAGMRKLKPYITKFFIEKHSNL
jgi:uncharacterized protein (DUF4213/DUF364 family)